jgi:hypothetical protein
MVIVRCRGATVLSWLAQGCANYGMALHDASALRGRRWPRNSCYGPSRAAAEPASCILKPSPCAGMAATILRDGQARIAWPKRHLRRAAGGRLCRAPWPPSQATRGPA